MKHKRAFAGRVILEFAYAKKENILAMMKARICAYLLASVLVTGCFAGCTELENGVYYDGQMQSSPNTALPESTVTTSRESKDFVPNGTLNDFIPDSGTDNPVTNAPSDSVPGGDTSGAESTTVNISDAIEPLVTASEWDYSSLDTERNGYGQGTHFDDLNRPRGALRFNEEYSKYHAKALNETEQKVIYLTFDQGYENGYTSVILDTLKEKGVKATFFVVYDYAKRQPELVQRMIDEGHTVGSHSWHHYSMPELSVEEAKKEIMDLHDYMIENFGICMNKFRPPKGEYSDLSLAVTSDLGYETVLWSFAYADWDPDKQPEPSASLQKLIDRAHPGAIYLLHSVSATNAEILGDFIDAMTELGYTFG